MKNGQQDVTAAAKGDGKQSVGGKIQLCRKHQFLRIATVESFNLDQICKSKGILEGAERGIHDHQIALLLNAVHCKLHLFKGFRGLLGMAGFVAVMLMLVGEIGKLFDTVQSVFGF